MNKATYRFLKILGALVLTLSTFHNALASGLSFSEPSAVISAQTTYYVSKNGNNQDGLSWATAWNELDRINWGVIRPGDTVYIDGGTNSQTYYSRLNVGASGTSTSQITVTGATDNGHNGQVVIDGQNSRSAGISISKSYVTVSNIKVINHISDDIRIDRASHVILDGLEVYITGRAVFIQYSDNIIVKNCIITTPIYVAKQTDGIYSQGNKNNIYENNYIVIYNQNAEGHDDAIQMYQDDSIIVRNNYLAQVNSKIGNAQGLYATTMFGISKFYNNVINLGDAKSNALSFRRLPSLGGTGNVEILENTVYAKNAYRAIWVTETSDPVIKNNIAIITNNTVPPLFVTDWNGNGSNIQSNLLYNPNTNKVANLGVSYTQTQMESAGINLGGSDTNPQLVDITRRDFHLTSSSPAIDVGRNLGLLYNVDKDGESRPQGSGYDIGAYEYSDYTQIPANTPIPSPTPTATNVLQTVTVTPTVIDVPTIATETPIPVSPTPTETSLLPTETGSPTSTETVALPIPSATELVVQPTATIPSLLVSPTPTESSALASPTPTQATTRKPRTETIYDDKDKAFSYSEGWRNVKNKRAYGGSLKVTTRNEAFVKLIFTGQSFSILYKGGHAFGKMNVYIDGKMVGTINQQQKVASQARWDYPSWLAPGKHTLKLVFVTNKKTKNQSRISLDAVIIR